MVSGCCRLTIERLLERIADSVLWAVMKSFLEFYLQVVNFSNRNLSNRGVTLTSKMSKWGALKRCTVRANRFRNETFSEDWLFQLEIWSSREAEEKSWQSREQARETLRPNHAAVSRTCLGFSLVMGQNLGWKREKKRNGNSREIPAQKHTSEGQRSLFQSHLQAIDMALFRNHV